MILEAAKPEAAGRMDHRRGMRGALSGLFPAAVGFPLAGRGSRGRDGAGVLRPHAGPGPGCVRPARRCQPPDRQSPAAGGPAADPGRRLPGRRRLRRSAVYGRPADRLHPVPAAGGGAPDPLPVPPGRGAAAAAGAHRSDGRPGPAKANAGGFPAGHGGDAVFHPPPDGVPGHPGRRIRVPAGPRRHVFCAVLHLGSRIFLPRPEQYIP